MKLNIWLTDPAFADSRRNIFSVCYFRKNIASFTQN